MLHVFIVVFTHPKGNSRHPDLGKTIYYRIPGYVIHIPKRKFMTSHPDLTCEQVPREGRKKFGEQSVNSQAKRVGVGTWKIRLFLKPVIRILKTSCFCTTVSRHRFCSCFRPEIWRKCCKELLKAASNSTSANSALHARIMQIYKQLSRSFNYLSQSCQQSTLQPIRSWYQELVSWNGSISGMSTVCTLSLPECSQLVPLAVDLTTLS